MRITALLAVALAAGLVAAGCGDDDDDTAATTSAATTGATGATGASGAPLSEDEFVKQANQICAQVNKKIEGGGGGQGGSVEDFANDTLIPAVDDGLAELGQLTPPEADADQYSQLLDEGQDALDGLKNDPGSIGPQTFKQFNQMAKDLGLDECGG